MARPGGPRPKCEADRAYRELIGHPPNETVGGSTLCSPEPPEPRDYPPPPAGSPKFVLCNGHLRDLFAELARLPSAPA
jgi:hypothetical protein